MLKTIVKSLVFCSTGLAIILASLMFPIFKILMILWIISYLGYMAYKYRNWTFIVPPVGGIMNLTAILLNGGKMPVLASPTVFLDPTHSIMTAGTHVKFLCDIFPLMHIGLFSLGDVTVALIWPLTVLGYYWYSHYRKGNNGKQQSDVL